MTAAQFLIARVEDGAVCFCQGDVSGIVSGEIVSQFPHTAKQWHMRIPLGGQRREPCEKVPAEVRVDSLFGRQSSERTYHFNIDQMRDKEGLITPGEFASNESARLPLVSSSTTTEASRTITVPLAVHGLPAQHSVSMESASLAGYAPTTPACSAARPHAPTPS
jgi:hypothetical protein